MDDTRFYVRRHRDDTLQVIIQTRTAKKNGDWGAWIDTSLEQDCRPTEDDVQAAMLKLREAMTDRLKAIDLCGPRPW